MNEPLYKELSEKIIGLAFSVHNALGAGLLEHCYEEAVQFRFFPFSKGKKPELPGGIQKHLYTERKLLDSALVLS